MFYVLRMVVTQDQIANLKFKYETLEFCFNEKSRRLWATTEALAYRYGGVSLVNKATGISNATIHKGIKEIENPSISTRDRIRQLGGGRKKITKTKRGLRKALISLVEATAKGDSMTPLRPKLPPKPQLKLLLVEYVGTQKRHAIC